MQFMCSILIENGNPESATNWSADCHNGELNRLGEFAISFFKTLVMLSAGVCATAHSAEHQDEQQGLPRFEVGVAGAGINAAAYPSSSVSIQRQFVLPWLIYRSDKVEVADGGIKLIAYQDENVTIDLGVGGSLSADTSETPVRDGMPDIDWLLELGPRIDFPLMDKSGEHWRERLNWISAYRFALSTDFRRVDFRGPVLKTELRYRKDGISNEKLSFNAAIGSTWLGDGMMDYFFSVEPQFETDIRPQFDADAGFLGIDLSAGMQYRPIPTLNTFVGVGLSSYDGSKNADSPLFEDKTNTRLILALSWQIYKSQETVSSVFE